MSMRSNRRRFPKHPTIQNARVSLAVGVTLKKNNACLSIAIYIHVEREPLCTQLDIHPQCMCVCSPHKIYIRVTPNEIHHT